MDKTIKLYNGKVTIEYKDGNHSYWLVEEKKRRLTGVTTFIGIINKPALIPWAVRTTVEYIREHMDELKKRPEEILELARAEADKQRDIAAEIGKAIHAWIEAHIKKEKPDMPEDPKVLKGVLNFLEWIENHKVKFIASEEIIYSQQFDYVGTLDILAKVDGKVCLIDIKTGNAIYAEAKMQTAAYQYAFEEQTGNPLDGRWIWRISKETEEEYNARLEAKNKPLEGNYKPFEAIYLDDDPSGYKRDLEGFVAAQKLYRWKQQADK